MVKVVKGPLSEWGLCSRTTRLGGSIHTLSHHNNSIAVGTRSGDIKILDVITGSQSAVLSGHTEDVHCVVFSSDGTSLVSGSKDTTVKLWDIQTGGVIKTFFGHTGAVSSVSISVGYTTIASGSRDGTICLWAIQTGECYHTIQQQGCVFHVRFSPRNPQHLISVSHDKVWQWDANGFQIRPPFSGSNVAFSPDGAQFVSCYRETITVRNSSSGEVVTEFRVAGYAKHCCLSPCNGLVAVATDETVHYWDITTSTLQPVETFVYYGQHNTSMTFSSSATLISGCYDGSIKFWQIGAIIDLRPTSPSKPIRSVTLQSKEGIAITSDSDGVIKAWEISTGICKKTSQFPAEDLGWRDIQLVNGKLILIWSEHERVHAWDAEDGQQLWEVDIPQSIVGDLKISGDGFRIFVQYHTSIWAWSLQTGEVVGKVEFEDQGALHPLIVDGSRVWVHWYSSDYRGWDFGIPGSAPIELSNESTPPGLSGLWDSQQVRIKNPATGKVVFQLPKRFSNPVHVQCDDSYLVAGYQSGEILILDLTNVK